MALLSTVDPEKAEKALCAWWQRRNPGHSNITIEDLEIPLASGMSSETILFALRRTEESGEVKVGHLAARVVLPGGEIFPDYDFHLEARAMKTVRATTRAPAPEVFAVEDDPSVLGAPFLLMQRLDGRTLADDPPFTVAGWYSELTDAGRAAIFTNGLAALAEVHRTDVSTFPPTILGHWDRAPGTATAQHLRHWEQFYHWSRNGRTHPIIEPALRWLNENCPTDEPDIGIVWGDARLGNMMFGADHHVTAVLDWELVALGPAEIDLGWFVVLNRMYTDGIGIKPPGGFPTKTETLARYGELTGRPVQNFHFYEVLAGVRLAIVLMRIAHMLIDKGMMPADNPMPVTNPATVVLADLLGIAAAGTEVGWVSGHRRPCAGKPEP
jgi:aminoglycoside phosphotransferase (APT) family kinase protein